MGLLHGRSKAAEIVDLHLVAVISHGHDYSKDLLAFCQRVQIPLIYASSAAVYGRTQVFREDADRSGPLNAYALSKMLFDMQVRRLLKRGATAQIVGLRYFNVYGPREAHKGSMASLVMQLDDQLDAAGVARLFGASDGFDAGEQRRDFVYVKDVVDVALWFLDHSDRSGIFNCGSGQSRTFNALAQLVIGFRGAGEIHYIPFPKSLVGRYQNFTEANLELAARCGLCRRLHSSRTWNPGISRMAPADRRNLSSAELRCFRFGSDT